MHATVLSLAIAAVAQVGGGGFQAPPLDPIAPAGPPPAVTMGEPTLASPGVGAPVEAGGNSILAPLPTLDRPAGGGVAPAAAERPLERPLGGAPRVTPQSLLGHGSTARPGGAGGAPLGLRETLAGAGSREAQRNATGAFWRLSLTIIDHHHAIDEVGLLRHLSAPPARHEQLMLEAAVDAAAARESEAGLAVRAARYDLAGTTLAKNAAARLPSDLPFVGKYRTNFQQLFTGGGSPPGLARIDETLPPFQALIETRAKAVASGGEALLALVEAYGRGAAPLSDILATFRELRQQRIAFLAAVRDYNLAIGQYAFAVAGPQLGIDQIVSMLIETEKPRPIGRSILVPTRGGATESAADNRPTLPAVPSLR